MLVKVTRKLFFLSLSVCLLLGGCAGNKPSAAESSSGISPSVSAIPDTLTISAELPVEYPKTLSKYRVDWCNVDERTVVDLLMEGESVECQEWAQGHIWYGEGPDGKNSLSFTNAEIQGGFHYFLHPSVEEDRGYKIDIINDDLRKHRPYEYGGDTSYQDLGNFEMEDYPEEEDLDFLPWQDAASRLEELLDECGVPEMELTIGESHSADVMNRNREIYNAALKESVFAGKTPEIEELTQEDEHYYFYYREVLDGIPFANARWSDVPNMWIAPEIRVLFDKYGLLSLSAENLLTVGESQEECAILSPEDALDVYLEEYGQALHLETTRLTGVELNYVVVKDGSSYLARPAWVFTLETDQTIPATEEAPEHSYVEIKALAVSADSGVILRKGTEKQ